MPAPKTNPYFASDYETSINQPLKSPRYEQIKRFYTHLCRPNGGGSANTQSTTVAQAQAALDARKAEWAEVRRTWENAVSTAKAQRAAAYEERGRMRREIMNSTMSMEEKRVTMRRVDVMVENAEKHYRDTVKGESRMEEERSRDLDKYDEALYRARNAKK